jgi:AP-1 complex subunit sigma 1/2
MDKYYGNVCEVSASISCKIEVVLTSDLLDIIFNFTSAYYILDELLIAGEMQESSKKNVLRSISQQDSLENMEVSVT